MKLAIVIIVALIALAMCLCVWADNREPAPVVVACRAVVPLGTTPNLFTDDGEMAGELLPGAHTIVLGQTRNGFYLVAEGALTAYVPQQQLIIDRACVVTTIANTPPSDVLP
jgi:hypothetical protein